MYNFLRQDRLLPIFVATNSTLDGVVIFCLPHLIGDIL